MQAYARSDIGKVREINEDSFVCLPPLFVVADGMGGHVAGEVASRMATDVLRKYLATEAGEGSKTTLLSQAIREANKLIYQMAREKSECAGMGTTVTAAFCEGARLFWGHVGDSRLYLMRARELRQLTGDHSLVSELVKSGNISPEEALTHPHRNILTRAVGTGDQVKVDTGSLDLEPGDRLLLCTDGLTNMVSDDDIAVVMQGGDGEALLDDLFARANIAGGLDNITAVLLLYGAD